MYKENGIKPSSDIPMNASSDSKFNFLVRKYLYYNQLLY